MRISALPDMGAAPMGLARRIVKRGKKIILSPQVMRWVSDDRVMKAAEGLMDARSRMKMALKILRDGQELPNIDPALDDHIGVSAPTGPNGANAKAKINGATNGSTNGSAALRADTADSEPSSESRPKVSPATQSDDLDESIKNRTSLAGMGGKDVFEKCYQFKTADNARKMGMYPFFRPLDYNDGPEAVIDGKRVVMFGSNNYLGLTTHPKVREAAKAAIDRFGTSMTGSRLVNGSMKLHNEFEEKLAAFFGKESALVFTTGYQVNIATCSALLSNKKTYAVIDRNVHASLYDGVRLGQTNGTQLIRYKHNDAESLERALEKLDDSEGALVLTDGVFSAEGEIAKLDQIVPVVKKYKARLMVDDAHALGVIGPVGRGTAHHFGLEKEVDLIGGTFSKSMASIGGWLVGEAKVLDYIRHFAPSFMFAASAAPPCVAAAMAAFDVMQEESWRIDKLRENFTYMRTELRKMGFDLGHTETAVIPIYIRQDLRTLMMWRELLEVHGVYTNPFISPGVPPKSAMLRTSYMATHERHHLDRGLEAIYQAGKKFGVIK
ncbi:MAG TPA: pyridoxal phosphate-dependent aminotransferase family protein [Polyangiaceae bacterium]|nr:pyridoxal phosphate-dependent aminotransferase family protein [Polyangiaceae bacterium]